MLVDIENFNFLALLKSQTFFLIILLFVVDFRKVHGPQRLLALHTVQGCQQMEVVEAAALQAMLGPTGAPTSTPYIHLSAKLEQIRAKIFVVCTLIALCWTRCA